MIFRTGTNRKIFQNWSHYQQDDFPELVQNTYLKDLVPQVLLQVLENRHIGTSPGKSYFWLGISSRKSSYWYQSWKIVLMVPVVENHPIGTSPGKSFYWYQSWKKSYWYQSWKFILLVPVLDNRPDFI
jgi:hypothetical protein